MNLPANLPTPNLTAAARPAYALLGVADLALDAARRLPRAARDVSARSDELWASAQNSYRSFVARGTELTSEIRRQPATEAAIREGREAVRRAEAAVAAARRAPAAVRQASPEPAASKSAASKSPSSRASATSSTRTKKPASRS